MLVKISLARLLKVKPQDAEKYITVLAGSEVKKGDVVARKKGFLGKEIVVKSRISGLADNYSFSTGDLTIDTGKAGSTETPERTENAKKSNTEKLNLTDTENVEKKRAEKKLSKTSKIGKNVIKGVFGFGKGEGKLEVCDGCLEFLEVNKDDAGKVILCKTISSNAVVYKASALGVEGLAVLNCRFRPKSKNIGFLVLSDKQDKNLWQKLKKWEGKRVRVEEGELISNS